MKERFKKFRHKIAYMIAPDLIEDLEERLSGLLCHTTGGRLSKPYYSFRVMQCEVDDYQQRMCEECEYYKGGETDA